MSNEWSEIDESLWNLEFILRPGNKAPIWEVLAEKHGKTLEEIHKRHEIVAHRPWTDDETSKALKFHRSMDSAGSNLYLAIMLAHSGRTAEELSDWSLYCLDKTIGGLEENDIYADAMRQLASRDFSLQELEPRLKAISKRTGADLDKIVRPDYKRAAKARSLEIKKAEQRAEQLAKVATAEAAAESVKQQTGEHWKNPPTIEECIERRNFLPALVALLSDLQPKPYSVEELRAAAEAAELLTEYERDALLAPEVQDARLRWMRIGDAIGRCIWVSYGGTIMRMGGNKRDGTFPVLVCGPVMIAGHGSNPDVFNPHLALKIRLPNGAWRLYLLPSAKLHSGGWQVDLAQQNLSVVDHETFSALLKAALASRDAPNEFVTAERVGHSGSHFVYPDGTIIGSEASVSISPTFPTLPAFGIGGTREEADAMLRLCEPHSRLALSICGALSAPFLEDLADELGGFHLYSITSRGKTTALCVGASLWGKGAEEKDGGIVQSWHSTAYAVEIVAAQHNDCPMFKDEMKLAKAEDVQPILFLLAKGAGKDAGTQHGSLRAKSRFRLMPLSTGEASVERFLQSKDIAYEGGDAVRLVDIPAEPIGGHGVFERAPDGMTPAEFSKHLKRQAATHYGHHARDLIGHLVQDRDRILKRAGEIMKHERAKLGEKFGDDPATGRVLDKFALVAAVGEVAIELKVLPWAAGSASNGISAVAADWHRERGGVGNPEALAGLRAFGQAVFSQKDRLHLLTPNVAVPRNRLAVWRFNKQRKRSEYFFTDDGLAEACGGAQRVGPFLDHLRAGLSDEWELIATHGKQYDAPKGYLLPKRMICLVPKGQAPAQRQRRLRRVRWNRRRKPDIPSGREPTVPTTETIQ